MNRTRMVIGAVVVTVVIAGCIRLGVWQLERLNERRADNASRVAVLSRPKVAITDTKTAMEPYRRVTASGRYDHSREIVVAARSLNGLPGVYLVTPLVDDDGGAVLVNRGWVGASDGITPELHGLEEPGVRTVDGVAMPPEQGPVWPLGDAWPLVVRRLAPADLVDRFPYALAPYVVRQLPDSALPARPRRVDLAPASVGPHLSYAIQWFSFALIAAVGAIALIRRTALDARLRRPRGVDA